ncbi:hypothetical protein SAMN05421640_3224 [Ekhidna lutea]|uniref:Outer membrane protein beta-barrel domain-containing protein n=1 Tax=Ekhidna lutea TaxID=447679 RepID=A0A239LF55_EKHLU|nr:hypothetical protein [Ekhidna lutea]SNT29101.1 hypothetical protein SAMN05421640_3224 [Ekhidna lutea]
MIRKLVLLMLVSPFFAIGQESIESEIKPIGGEKTLEVQLTPFGDTPVGINGIRVRWFKSESKVTRLNLFLGLDSDTDIIQQEDTGQEELKARTSELVISLRPGFENHIQVSERMSPYFGLELDLTYQTSSQKVEEQNGSDVNYTKLINGAQSGFVRLGANAIAGMDYYVAKKLYLGTEFGFGFSYTGYLPSKIKSDIAGFNEPEPEKQGSALDVGPNIVAQIRLGYAF